MPQRIAVQCCSRGWVCCVPQSAAQSLLATSHPTDAHFSIAAKNAVIKSSGSSKRTSALHFKIGAKQRADVPFHLRLTLANTKSTIDDWHLNYRPRLVSTTMLRALGKTGLVDIKARVIGLHGYDEIQGF